MASSTRVTPSRKGKVRLERQVLACNQGTLSTAQISVMFADVPDRARAASLIGRQAAVSRAANRRYMRLLRPVAFLVLVVLAACGHSYAPAPYQKVLGSQETDQFTLTVTNDGQLLSPPAGNISIFLDTNCFNVNPPYEFLIPNGGQSASFKITGLNNSGACFFESSYGTISLLDASGGLIDKATLQYAGTGGSTGTLYVDCGSAAPNNIPTVNAGNGGVLIYHTWTYDYGKLKSGYPYGTCTWDGSSNNTPH